MKLRIFAAATFALLLASTIHAGTPAEKKNG